MKLTYIPRTVDMLLLPNSYQTCRPHKIVEQAHQRFLSHTNTIQERTNHPYLRKQGVLIRRESIMILSGLGK